MTTDAEIQKWIIDLLAMYERHSVELDHKDCGELAELLTDLSKRQTEQIQELKNKCIEIEKNSPYKRFERFKKYLEKMQKEMKE